MGRIITGKLDPLSSRLAIIELDIILRVNWMKRTRLTNSKSVLYLFHFYRDAAANLSILIFQFIFLRFVMFSLSTSGLAWLDWLRVSMAWLRAPFCVWSLAFRTLSATDDKYVRYSLNFYAPRASATTSAQRPTTQHSPFVVMSTVTLDISSLSTADRTTVDDKQQTITVRSTSLNRVRGWSNQFEIMMPIYIYIVIQ